MPVLFEAERRSAVRKAAIWIAVLGIAHFALGTQTHAIHGLHIVLAQSAIQHQEVQAPLRKEEAMGGVHHLLAAEIPDVHRYHI